MVRQRCIFFTSSQGSVMIFVTRRLPFPRNLSYSPSKCLFHQLDLDNSLIPLKTLPFSPFWKGFSPLLQTERREEKPLQKGLKGKVFSTSNVVFTFLMFRSMELHWPFRTSYNTELGLEIYFCIQMAKLFLYLIHTMTHPQKYKLIYLTRWKL